MKNKLTEMYWQKLQTMPYIPKLLSWFGWTLLLCFLLLSPSDGTVHNLSSLFGGTEVTDAIGHIILIGVECILTYLVMLRYLPLVLAQKLALICTLAFGIFLELAQLFIPSRGASLIDIMAAFIGVGCVYVTITKILTYPKNE